MKLMEQLHWEPICMHDQMDGEWRPNDLKLIKDRDFFL